MEEHEYSNGEITIIWKPNLCQHAKVCVKTLPKVYNPSDRPWIHPDNATSNELIDQVSKCPSGALTIKKDIRLDQEDNGKKGRFIIFENNKFAGEMTYVWNDLIMIIDHTGIESEFEGNGYGKKLLAKAVEYARQNNVKILPLCPFANRMFNLNKDLADIRA